jgi:glucose-6-phosphate 1-epimerase
MMGMPASNRIERMQGKGGMPWLRLVHASGYSVVVSEYGAHVLSWQDPTGAELLFVSEAAIFERGKPIRGGIPLVFPQFGKGALPQHGFARVSSWKVIREQVSTTGAVSVTFRLVPDEAINAVWPHPFVAEFDVVLTDVLLTTLRVENTGVKEFQFTSALHTYFRIGDIAGTELHGLDGTEFIDFLNQRKVSLETRAPITFDGPIDRAYQDSPHTLHIVSRQGGRRYSVTKEGFSDTVVWNPWVETAKTITDFLPTEYTQMLCVESGNVLTPIKLPAGEKHTSVQILRVE